MAIFIGTLGNDDLVGTSGDDAIYGYDPADPANTDGGNDRLSGLDSVAAGRDTIDDFQQGADHVDLAAIDADTSAAGDQAFSFIGSAAFSHAAAQLRQTGDGAGNTVIEGDIQGDGVGDFQILLKGAYALQGADFIL